MFQHQFEFGKLDYSGTIIIGIVNHQNTDNQFGIGIYDLIDKNKSNFQSLFYFQNEIPNEIHLSPDIRYLYTINKSGIIFFPLENKVLEIFKE